MRGPGLPDDEEERRGETRGAPPRMATRRPENWDPYVGPGAPEKPDVAYKAPRGRGGPAGRLWPLWQTTVVPLAFGKNCITVPERPQFNANVAHLMQVKGLSEDDLAELFETFAGRVDTGQVNITGKNAWGVFMKVWPKLRGRASDEGLRAVIEGRALTRPEDWT